MVKTKDDITDLLIKNRLQIQQFGAKSIGLFGSFVSNQQNDISDVDIIIEFDKGQKNFDNFINLSFFLEDLFERKVDLVTPESISKYIKPHIIKNIEYVSLSIWTTTTYQGWDNISFE